MPMLDAVFVGKIYLPEIGGGPIYPPPGSGNVPMPPIYYPPVFPAHPIAGPPEWGHHPAHPIAPGGPPPTVSPPIFYPPYPAHPIAPGGPPPVAGWTPPGYHPAHPIAPGGPPPGIWGPTDPKPTHPIVLPLPPVEIPPPEGGGEGKKLEVKAVWTQQTGWFVVAVPGEGTEVPTPSS